MKTSYLKKERHLRCSYCNKTASEDIASDPFEYDNQLYFRQDPRDPTVILCSECLNEVNQALFEMQDDVIYDDYFE